MSQDPPVLLKECLWWVTFSPSIKIFAIIYVSLYLDHIVHFYCFFIFLGIRVNSQKVYPSAYNIAYTLCINDYLATTQYTRLIILITFSLGDYSVHFTLLSWNMSPPHSYFQGKKIVTLPIDKVQFTQEPKSQDLGEVTLPPAQNATDTSSRLGGAVSTS